MTMAALFPTPGYLSSLILPRRRGTMGRRGLCQLIAITSSSPRTSSHTEHAISRDNLLVILRLLSYLSLSLITVGLHQTSMETGGKECLGFTAAPPCPAPPPTPFYPRSRLVGPLCTRCQLEC